MLISIRNPACQAKIPRLRPNRSDRHDCVARNTTQCHVPTQMCPPTNSTATTTYFVLISAFVLSKHTMVLTAIPESLAVSTAKYSTAFEMINNSSEHATTKASKERCCPSSKMAPASPTELSSGWVKHRQKLIDDLLSTSKLLKYCTLLTILLVGHDSLIASVTSPSSMRASDSSNLTATAASSRSSHSGSVLI